MIARALERTRLPPVTTETATATSTVSITTKETITPHITRELAYLSLSFQIGNLFIISLNITSYLTDIYNVHVLKNKKYIDINYIENR